MMSKLNPSNVDCDRLDGRVAGLNDAGRPRESDACLVALVSLLC